MHSGRSSVFTVESARRVADGIVVDGVGIEDLSPMHERLLKTVSEMQLRVQKGHAEPGMGLYVSQEVQVDHQFGHLIRLDT